jgi:hypothetical protein
MNPFGSTDQSKRAALLSRFKGSGLLLVLGISLAAGLVLVGWRTLASRQQARSQALADLQIASVSMEQQLHAARAAAEMLALGLRTTAAPHFPNIASAVLAVHPGLSGLEVQPNGVISDVYPRQPNEKALGVNVFKHPARTLGANLAFKRRALSIVGPVPLPRGVSGVVATVPIFQRGRDNRETFWGLAAVCAAFPEMLARARVHDLGRKGYDYALLAPAPPPQKAAVITEVGTVNLGQAVQVPVRFGDLELTLAARPRAGWVDRTELIVSSVLALLFTGLMGLVWISVTTRQELAAAAHSAEEQLAQRTEAGKKAEEQWREAQEIVTTLQAELKQLRVGYQEAQARQADLRTKLEEATARAHQAQQALESTTSELQRKAAEYQARCEAAEKLTDTHRAERERIQRIQEENDRTLQNLRTRLDQVLRTEKETSAAAQKREEQHHALVAQLQGRLDELLHANHSAAQELEETRAQNQAALGAAQESVRALRQQLAEEERDRGKAEAKATARAEADRGLIAELQERLATLASVPSAVESPEPEALVPPALAAPEEAVIVAPPEPASVPEETPADLVNAPAPAEPEPLPDALSEEEALHPGRHPKPARRKKEEDQMDLWGGVSGGVKSSEPTPETEEEPEAEHAKEPKRRHSAPNPSIPIPELRRLMGQILPLLVDQDPGAADCLQENRDSFRSAFPPEEYDEFEALTNKGNFGPALEHLKKAAKRLGISL